MSGRTAWCIAIMAVALFAASLPTKRVWGTTAAESDTASQERASSQTEKPVPTSPAPELVGAARPVTSEIPVEMERRFNDLRREFLDQEVQAVHRWLTVLAVILTVMGVLVPIAAYFGFRRFHEIERESQAILKEIRSHEKEAQQRVDRIGVTAEDAAKDEKVQKEAQAATEVPGASLIDIAVAEALTLQKKERVKEAIAKWEAIANLVQDTDPNQAARAHYSVGYLYTHFGAEIQNGSTSEDAQKRAIHSFNETIRLKPDHANAYFNRGASRAELKQYEAAIADLDEAIRLQPDHAGGYHNRGVSKAELEQHAAAIADLDEAIRLRPDYADSYHSRGLSKTRLEQYTDAIADFDEAIRLQPEQWNAYHGRGISKAELGQYAAAIADLDEVIRLQPDHAASYYIRGFSKGRLEESEAAIVDFDEAIRLRPDFAQAYGGRGAVKADLKQYEAAIADLDEAIRLQPDNAGANFARGAVKVELKQYEAAIADLDEAIRLQPDNADAYFDRGAVKAELRQYEAAIVDLDKAISLQPDHVSGYRKRAESKAALGHDDGAASDRAEAARLAAEIDRPEGPSG